MTKEMKRRSGGGVDGLIFLFLGAATFLAIGFAWKRLSPIDMGDFKVVYYSARTLLAHGDPYSQAAVLEVYRAEGRENPAEPVLDRDVKTRFFYPPTAFIVTVPIAILGFAAGKVVWMLLCAGSLIFSGFLIWDISREFAPAAAGVLPGMLLAGSFWLFMVGNAAAIVVSLCVIATWCFCRERFAWFGVFALAMSLALKPNDSGLVWLFYLLAAPRLRKRALQSMFMLVVLSLPVVVWTFAASPHWLQELRANMASFGGVGGIVDPGIAGMAAKNMDCIVQLQTAISVIFPSPEIYTVLTWGICLPLVIVWTFWVVKTHPEGNAIWLPLAAAAPLSMLPTYHFQHDAKLLLLCIPAGTMLWAGRGAIGRWALALTAAAILINGDIFTGSRILLTHGIVIPEPNLLSRLMAVLFTRPGPVALLATSVFFLYAYWRYREADSYWLVSGEITVTNASGN